MSTKTSNIFIIFRCQWDNSLRCQEKKLVFLQDRLLVHRRRKLLKFGGALLTSLVATMSLILNSK